ncbi:hypothetical protein J1N35_037226 [Gossypium stocksii]|uniref:Uncharacterized protein n=1 Tax=Gossypium stocksii TaxID=47602 RepID=A0A9D3ZLK3_9ROSI|nr:hypothetical protein J1N35_037226 [Gossypium stocksii]
MQEAGLIFEDYVRKCGLKLPLFLATKYEVVTELSKVKKERELEEEGDPKEDLGEDSEGEQCQSDEALNPASD